MTAATAPTAARRAAGGGSRRRAVTAVGAALLVAALAACGGGAGSGSAGGAQAAADATVGGRGDVAAPEASGGSGGSGTGDGTDAKGGTGTSTAARVLPSDRDVVYTGSIAVRVKDVSRAADRVESLALGVDGVVFSERTSTDPRRPRYGEATMTVRVPPSAFKPTLDGIGRLGRELSRERSAEDVTTQVADVGSRVRSQQRSVDRVRALLAQAKTIGEVVQVEAELSRREADLESLQAQLTRLEDVTSLATIDVRLVSPQPAPAPRVYDSGLGFLSGLRDGWDAFAGIVLVALTVLGAVVPFVAAGAVLSVPLLLVWRSRRRTPGAPPSATADA